MGDLHNELRRSLLSKALTRALGDTKGAAGIERFGETLTPVIDLWALPEWALLRRELLKSTSVNVGAVVAEFGSVALLNPVNSGIIAVVEACEAMSVAQTTYSTQRATVAQISATLTQTVNGTCRDTRTLQIGQGIIQVFAGTDPGVIGTTLEQVIPPPGGSTFARFVTSLPFIITPGFGLVIQASTANITNLINIGWRERAALPGELD